MSVICQNLSFVVCLIAFDPNQPCKNRGSEQYKVTATKKIKTFASIFV